MIDDIEEFLDVLAGIEAGWVIGIPTELECNAEWTFARVTLPCNRIIRMWIAKGFTGDPPPIRGNVGDERELLSYLVQEGGWQQ